MDKKDTQSAWIDIAVFAAVVAFFLFSAHSLTKSRTPESTPKLMDSVERLPASEQHENPAYALPESIKTIDVGCMGEHPPLSAAPEINLLRLVGSWCGSERPTHASGKHDGTGAEILTFTRPASASFTTSYFPLQEGTNKISFELEYKGGKTRRENFEVVRNSQNK